LRTAAVGHMVNSIMGEKQQPKRPANVPSASKLRAMRKKKGWSIEYCAEKIGVAERTWHMWELPKQNRWPSPSHAILIELLFSGKLGV
jgi:DNA-binding XRE family transcriptional regulator